MTSFYFHCNLSNWFYYWIVIERICLALSTGGGGEKATQGRPSPQRDIESHRFFTSQRLPGFRDSQFRIETLNVDGFPLIHSSWWKDKRKPNSYGTQCWTSLNSCHQRTIELIELKRVSFVCTLYFFQLVYLYVCHISVYINTTLVEVKEYICYTVIMW